MDGEEENVPIGSESLLNVLQLALLELVNSLHQRRALLLQRHSNRLLVPSANQLGLNNRLSQRLLNAQPLVGLLSVNGQVIGRSISASNALDPSVGRLDFGVPAVGSVVGHLVRHVLSETKSRGVDADRHEEREDSGDEVAEGLVVDDALEFFCSDRLGGQTTGESRKLRKMSEKEER